jgi:hypothetical protein
METITYPYPYPSIHGIDSEIYIYGREGPPTSIFRGMTPTSIFRGMEGRPPKESFQF